MNALPDLYDYSDPEALTPPEPSPCSCGSLLCDWCGDEAYAPRRYSSRDHDA